jgi:glutamyl-tRNA reductase
MESCQVLLVGVGEMLELVASHLQGQGVHKFLIANRTLEKASVLSEQIQGQAIRIGDIPHHLTNVDIVITATASQLPIIGKGLLETVLKHREKKPLFMVDLAVPRDIEPEIAELENVYLYNIDDLQNITAQNKQNREEAAAQAEAIIDIQARHYLQKLQILNAGDMIRHFRNRMESMRDEEVEKAIQKLRQGMDRDIVLTALARNLTNKFMHQPTIKLREAAYHDDVNLMLIAKEILDI